MMNSRGGGSESIVALVAVALIAGDAIGCASESEPTRAAAEPQGPATPSNAAGSVATNNPNDTLQLGDAGKVGLAPSVPADMTAGSICTPGHYVGTFSGTYKSSAWLNGTVPLDFATADFESKPGFEFWLEAVEQPCPPGTEFCPGATVKGGKLRGFANPFADASAGAMMPVAGAGATDPFALSVRFEMDLTGELDCATGKFRGRLQNGCYDVLSVLYRFAGTLKSDYDHITTTFKNGTWEITELPMDSLIPPDPSIGGTGVWNAKLADSGAAPTVDGMGLCDGMTGLDTPTP
jgi:hypothetical protein